MPFRGEVAVCVRNCNYRCHSGSVLALSAAEIFSEGGAQVFLSYELTKRRELICEGDSGKNKLITPKTSYDYEQL